MACISKTDYKRRLRESPPEIFHTQHLQKTQLGHTYPSSAAPYVIATDADVEDEQGDLIDIFINPDIEKRRKK